MKRAPGSFEQLILYKKDANGRIREWSISADDYVIDTAYGVVGGEIQEDSEIILEGKASRTRDEQMLLKINSKIERKLDKGFYYSMEDAQMSSGENRIGLPRAMLAKKYKPGMKLDVENCIIQHKYNGFRCMISKVDGEYIAYSRNGKQFKTIDHIFDSLDLDEGEIVDGELYCHGQTLQTISSWAKRKQPESSNLKYHMYDYVSDLPYMRRLSKLRSCIKEDQSIAEMVPMFFFSNMIEVEDFFVKSIAMGYEGLMIRLPDGGYDVGKKSNNLLKLKSIGGKKHLHDDEFLVIGLNASVDDYAILICCTKAGVKFKVTAPGSHSEKREVLRNQKLYLGRYVQVGYSELTPDGKPFHPVALQWRNKYEE